MKREPKKPDYGGSTMKLSVLALAFIATSAMAEEIAVLPAPQPTVDAYVINELKCQNAPDAFAAVLALAANSVIHLPSELPPAPLQCFEAQMPWSIDGLQVQRICASWTSDNGRSDGPKILWPANLSQNRTQLSLELYQAQAQVAAWAQPKGIAAAQITTSSDGGSRLTCHAPALRLGRSNG
ncbi:hypothetical protein MED193_18974 [Roseobacter sp. MED193]|nr:hypothetical protein MED193_18974 [Roseobacter sp. MED193]